MPISNDVINSILKNDPQRTHLDLHESALSGDDITALVTALEKNTAVTSLDLSRNNLTTDDIQGLRSLTRIEKINLAQNNIKDDGVEFLLKISSLTSLNLNDNRLTDVSGQKLAEKSSPSFYVSVFGNRKISQEVLGQIESARQADPENTSNALNATTPFWRHSSAPVVSSCATEHAGDKRNNSGNSPSPPVIDMH